MRARARLAAILHELVYASVLTEGVSLVESWAASAQVSDETVRHWCDATRATSTVTVGDLDVMLDAPEFERFVSRWRESREAPPAPLAASPAHAALLLMVQLGRVARDAAETLAAATVTPDALAALEVGLQRLYDHAGDVLRGVRAARRAARGVR